MDMNADGRADIVDALLIAQYSVGIITDFPITKQTIQTTDLIYYNNDYTVTFTQVTWLNGLHVLLRDRTGRPLAGKTITIDKTKGYSWSLDSNSRQTDANGKAYFKFNIAVDSGSDDYLALTTTFAGDTFYSPASCQFFVNMHSPKHPTQYPTPNPTPAP